ncbi:MAG: hypothetical protein ACRCXN_00910 [Bacteroidales bacterium]
MNKKILMLGCTLIFLGTAINVEKALSNYNFNKKSTLLKSTGTDDQTIPKCNGYNIYCHSIMSYTLGDLTLECTKDGSLGVLGASASYKKRYIYKASCKFGTCIDSSSEKNICVKPEQGIVQIYSVTEIGTAI